MGEVRMARQLKKWEEDVARGLEMWEYNKEQQVRRVEAYHAAKAALAVALKDEGWTPHFAPNGVEFFYHEKTGLSTFEAPDFVLSSSLAAKNRKRKR